MFCGQLIIFILFSILTVVLSVLNTFLNTHAQSDSSSFVISCTILFNNADQMNSSLFSVTLIIVRRSTDNTIVKRKGTKYEKFSNIHHTKMGIILGAPEG